MSEPPNLIYRTMQIGTQKIILDDFQERAFQLLENGASLFVSAPTSSGKTLIAIRAAELVLAESNAFMVYTTPLKALSNQKFREFVKIFGKEKVGLLTGDVQINIPAPIMIMTTEIYCNALISYDSKSGQTNLIINQKNLKFVVFDEIHYFSDKTRGVTWELSLMITPQLETRIIMLSATTGATERFLAWLRSIRKEEIAEVWSNQRPVPLQYHFRFNHPPLEIKFNPNESPFKTEEMEKLFGQSLFQEEEAVITGAFPHADRFLIKNGIPFFTDDHYPMLKILFSRAGVEEAALNFRDGFKESLASKPQRINEFNHLIEKFSNSSELKKSGSYSKLLKTLQYGCAFHHAGVLPQLKECIELMVEKGLIPVIFSTETFAVGVNLPFKSVVFEELVKFDGARERLLNRTELEQLGGRAGRRGIDQSGNIFFKGSLYTLQELANVFQRPYQELVSNFEPSAFLMLNLLNNLPIGQISNLFKRSYFFYRDKTKKIEELVHFVINELLQHELIGKQVDPRVPAEDLTTNTPTSDPQHSILVTADDPDTWYKLTQKGIFASRIPFRTIPVSDFCFKHAPFPEINEGHQIIAAIGCLMEYSRGKEDKLRQNLEIYLGHAHHRLSDLPLPPVNRTQAWAQRISQHILSTGTKREKPFLRKFDCPMDQNQLWLSESVAPAYFYKDVYELIQDYNPESRLGARLLDYRNTGHSDEINLGAGFLVWLWIHHVPYDIIMEITLLSEGDLFEFYKLFLEILKIIRKAYAFIGNTEGAQFFQHWERKFEMGFLKHESLYLLEANPLAPLAQIPPSNQLSEFPEASSSPSSQDSRPEQQPDRRFYVDIKDTPAYLNAVLDTRRSSLEQQDYEDYDRYLERLGFTPDEACPEDEEGDDDDDFPDDEEVDDDDEFPEDDEIDEPDPVSNEINKPAGTSPHLMPILLFEDAIQCLIKGIENAAQNGYSLRPNAISLYMRNVRDFKYHNALCVQKPDLSGTFSSFGEFLNAAEKAGHIKIQTAHGVSEVLLVKNHPLPQNDYWKLILEIISEHYTQTSNPTPETGLGLKPLRTLLKAYKKNGILHLSAKRLENALQQIIKVGFLIPSSRRTFRLADNYKEEFQPFLEKLKTYVL